MKSHYACTESNWTSCCPPPTSPSQHCCTTQTYASDVVFPVCSVEGLQQYGAGKQIKWGGWKHTFHQSDMSWAKTVLHKCFSWHNMLLCLTSYREGCSWFFFPSLLWRVTLGRVVGINFPPSVQVSLRATLIVFECWLELINVRFILAEVSGWGLPILLCQGHYVGFLVLLLCFQLLFHNPFLLAFSYCYVLIPLSITALSSFIC